MTFNILNCCKFAEVLKKIITYLLLGLYLHAAFAPYMPVINYVFNYEFYKTVLCENKSRPELKCNGKCHLMKELKASNSQNSDAKLPVPTIDLSKLPISLLENYNSFELFLFKKNRSNTFFYTHKAILQVDVSKSTPPPDTINA